MIDVIIIDDEPGCVSNLKYYLSKYCPEINIVAEGYTVTDAKNIIKTKTFDLAFLDIELMNENIFSLFNDNKQHNFDIVFVTAYESYAVKAFKVQAFDYLMKPLLKADVLECYKKILKRFADKKNTLQTGNADASNLVLRNGEKVYVIKYEDVIYLKASGVYTQIAFEHAGKIKSITTSKPIGDLEKEYGHSFFFRVHKSYIINLNKIAEINKSDIVTVRIGYDLWIPVAKRRTREFFTFLETQ